MKKQKRRSNSTNTTKAPGDGPTIEEIQQRAQEIFLARGATPGMELDDWLSAERELKDARARANTDSSQLAMRGTSHETTHQIKP
jgi:hypothetical protein